MVTGPRGGGVGDGFDAVTEGRFESWVTFLGEFYGTYALGPRFQRRVALG